MTCCLRLHSLKRDGEGTQAPGEGPRSRGRTHGRWSRPQNQQNFTQRSYGAVGCSGSHLERYSSLRAWTTMRVMFTDMMQKGKFYKRRRRYGSPDDTSRPVTPHPQAPDPRSRIITLRIQA